MRSWVRAFVAILLPAALPLGAQDLFVASRNSDAILRLDSRGGFAGVLASGGVLDEPSCLAVGSDGSIYAGMRDSSSVRRVGCWSASGASLWRVTIPGLTAIAGVAVDGAGNVYASSQTANEVIRWDAGRTIYGTFAYGSGLSQPAGLAFGPDGKLYIASSASGQVLAWNPDGTFDRVFRSFGSSARPLDLAFASNGDMYILMTLTSGGAGVGVYSSSGAYKRYHAGGASLSSPTGIALRPGDDAVFASDFSSGILQLGSDGVFRTVLAQGTHGLNGASGLRFRDRPPVSSNALIVQGVLATEDGSAVPDSTYQAAFRFYSQQAGGSPLWTSAQQSLDVSGSVFSARLESVPEWLFARDSLWLETVVGSTPLSPRQLLGSQGVSIRSVTAGSLRALSGGATDFWIGPRRALSLTHGGAFTALSPGGVMFGTAVDPAGQASAGVRIAPGAGSWSTLSDASAKEWYGPACSEQVLELLARLPVLRWRYVTQGPEISHMGPMSDDFRSAFGLGDSDRAICTVDADGVALAAMKALIARTASQQQTIERLERLVEQWEGRKRR